MPAVKSSHHLIIGGTIGRAIVAPTIAIAGLAFLCSIGTLAVPLFNMQIFNRVLPTRDLTTLGNLVFGLLGSVITFAAIEQLKSIAQELLAARLARQISVPLIQAASLSARPDVAASEAMADVEQVRSFIAGRACMAPFDIAWSPIMLLALVSMHWALGAFALLCVVLMVSLNILGDVISRQSILIANHQSAAALRSASDGVMAAEAVMALGIMPILAVRWRNSQFQASQSVRQALSRARAVSSITTASRAGMTGAMVALGLGLALNGFASSGSMVAANMILGRLLMPFTGIAASRREWLDVLAAYKRLTGALSSDTSYRSTAIYPPPEGKLSIEGLVYVPEGGDRAVIRNLCLNVEAGEAVALVGPSSAGKTTLARLIAGIIPASAGGVYLDGSNVFHWAREDFAQYVGFCPQRPTLVEETIADNIARLQSPNWADIVNVTRRVGLHETIAALPQGYSTIVRGSVLSGGQRQRLALARALYGNPKLLVLDEPSAFLDEAGEHGLVRLLFELRKEGTTLIVVTHRPILLEAMDKVIVMRDGAIAHSGTPAEVATSLVYRPIQLVKAVNNRLNVS